MKFTAFVNALLSHVDVAGDARRRGEHEGPLAAVRVRDGSADLGVSGFWPVPGHPAITLPSRTCP